MPFRTAHGVSAQAVRIAIEKECRLEELSIEEWKSCSDLIQEDIYSIITPQACVKTRNTIGGPAPERVDEQIKELKNFVKEGK